jgi:hypothetical protein
MLKYLYFSFSGINLIPTTILLLLILYWLLTIFGFVSSDFLDLDIDFDNDSELEFNSNPNFFMKIIEFSNLHTIPIMVFFSFYSMFLWILTMMISYYKGSTLSKSTTILFVINLFISFLLTKLATNFLVSFFKNLESNNNFNPLGKKCKLTTNLEPGRLGTAIIESEKGRVILLNVKCENKIYKKGEMCIIIKKIEDKDVYIIE